MRRPCTRLIGPLLVAGLVCLSGCENSTLPVAKQGYPESEGAELSAMPEQPLDPALLEPAEGDFRLGPGDQLECEIMGDISTRATVTVGPDGKIYYNILPGLDVWGLTLAEARDRLGNELKRFIREKPVVTLSLRTATSQRVWLLGRLNNPGVYPLSRPTSLLEAVAQAGGLGVNVPVGGMPTEAADLSRSFLIRAGHLVPVDFQRLLMEGDPSQNVYLRPDDFVYIPSLRSAQVHVIGAVLQPRSERTNGALTVVQAIALAGGTVPDACLSNVAILRGSLAHPQVAIVAVDQVLHGKAPDVRLEPNDIVYVPFKPERLLEKYVNLALDTFVRTIGVNEGAYAASGSSVPVAFGVSIAP